jgi:uncharacterized membrane protein YphA (DoxX/SURF4 family)
MPFSYRLLKYSLVGVFLYFSLSQLIAPADWVGLLPSWTGYLPIPGEMLIRLNGWFEFMACAALLLGVFPRLMAWLLGLHLFGIALSLSGPTRVRDLGLALAMISLAMQDHRVGTS